MDRTIDTTMHQGMHLQRQRFRTRAWIRTRLWAQVLVGMAAGLALGTLLGPDVGLVAPATSETIASWLALPGMIFLGLIAMVLVPLVFASIVGGLAGSASAGALKAVAGRLALFVLATTVLAVTLGATLANLMAPGAGMGGTLAPAPRPTAGNDAFDLARAPEVLAAVLPTNPTASIVQGDLLAVVVLAVLVGLACLQVDRERIAPFLRLLDALLSIAMEIVKWAMFLAPFAVFGLMAQLVMRIGLGTVAAMSAYVLTVIAGLAILLCVYLALLWLRAGVSPGAFLKGAGSTMLLAFSTSSSSAIMPMTIATARRLGVPEATANLVVPLGATMNMAGTALYQSVAILFLAQMAGIELGLGETALIAATLVATSIGAPGTPGVSIAILMSVAAGFGIPVEGMVIILGVDRILDMARTTVNVTGDLVACILLRETGAGEGAGVTAGAAT
ncbi:dicarboxylate/amino acid:cation symporter [Salinarimonas sp.]|uniref:dicarboxylate/amino acid:cation symporter n=1 Tax=Salinarimonas sp. TaxID=2766526 RepID=UPI00391BDF05